MPRFFVTSEQINDGAITLVGADAHHVARSLRMAVGDEITVLDGAGREYTCAIASFDEDAAVKATILSVGQQESEPPLFITLYQALPKGDKLDTVIQKAVECGVSRIVPFESERCIVRAKPEAEEKKQLRRQRIADEAAKQCGRGILPEVASTCSFAAMIEAARHNDAVLFCFEGEGTTPIGQLLYSLDLGTTRRVGLVVGSEGGFALKEAETAKSAGFYMTGLGKRILRTETAPLFALSCISLVSELS